MRRARFRWWPLLLGPAVIVPHAFGAPGDSIFAGLQAHTVAIDFSQPAYWDSLTQYYDDGLEQYMAARVTVDGVPYDSVGVRLKGNASYTHPNLKKPFRLSFDEYRDAQRWDGLKGVEQAYELPPEATNNIYEMTPEERAAEGIGALPQSLAEAIEVMEGSELVAEALGEHVFEYFIRNKRKEWREYKAHVSPWEIDHYLGSL